LYTFESVCEGCIRALFGPVPGGEEGEVEFLACKDLAEGAVDLERGLCAHKETAEGGDE
jgi:hypothetical protein